MGKEGMLFSRGWIAKFKKRRGLVLSKTYGEAADVDEEVVEEARSLVLSWIHSTPAHKIFNMDETGLFYNLEPSRRIIHAREKRFVRGNKKQKDRVTVALTCNGTGSIKLKPMLIGKSAKPRAFKNFKIDKHVRYASSPTAWMTTALFKEYLTDFDRQLRTMGI